MSVNTWFWFWLDELKKDSIRHGTRDAYINRYNSSIKDVIGHMSVEDVRPMHCQMAINKEANIGASEWSMKKTRVIMRAIFTAAVDNMMIEKNPVTKWICMCMLQMKKR